MHRFFYLSESALSKYDSYEGLESSFKQLQKEFPDLAKLSSIGKSVQNRDILVLQVRVKACTLLFLFHTRAPNSKLSFSYFPFFFKYSFTSEMYENASLGFVPQTKMV